MSRLPIFQTPECPGSLACGQHDLRRHLRHQGLGPGLGESSEDDSGSGSGFGSGLNRDADAELISGDLQPFLDDRAGVIPTPFLPSGLCSLSVEEEGLALIHPCKPGLHR